MMRQEGYTPWGGFGGWGDAAAGGGSSRHGGMGGGMFGRFAQGLAGQLPMFGGRGRHGEPDGDQQGGQPDGDGDDMRGMGQGMRFQGRGPELGGGHPLAHGMARFQSTMPTQPGGGEGRSAGGIVREDDPRFSGGYR